MSRAPGPASGFDFSHLDLLLDCRGSSCVLPAEQAANWGKGKVGTLSGAPLSHGVTSSFATSSLRRSSETSWKGRRNKGWCQNGNSHTCLSFPSYSPFIPSSVCHSQVRPSFLVHPHQLAPPHQSSQPIPSSFPVLSFQVYSQSISTSFFIPSIFPVISSLLVHSLFIISFCSFFLNSLFIPRPYVHSQIIPCYFFSFHSQFITS